MNWIDKLQTKGKATIHPKYNYTWISIIEYWNKYRIDTSFSETFYPSSIKEAKSIIKQLTSH